MGDQLRWWKLWTNAISDPAIVSLPPARRWAWAALGAYTTAHGRHGVLHTAPDNPALAVAIGCEPGRLVENLIGLPGVWISTAPLRWPHGGYNDRGPECDGEILWRGQAGGAAVSKIEVPRYARSETAGGRNGQLTVTWRNWSKYQLDTTAAARGAALRSKRRGEERRGEGINTPPNPRTAGADVVQHDLADDEIAQRAAPPARTTASEPCRSCLAAVRELNDLTGQTYPGPGRHRAALHGFHGRYGLDVVLQVVRAKVQEWGEDRERAKYLRPETLFHPDKFESYRNALRMTTQRGEPDGRRMLLDIAQQAGVTGRKGGPHGGA